MLDSVMLQRGVMVVLLVIASWWLTGRVRRYALQKQMLDVPNARSSHSAPTPRGGGLAIVVSFLVAVLVMAATGLIAGDVAVALIGGGGGTALIGFMDDRKHVPARWRLLAHFGAALWALAWLFPWSGTLDSALWRMPLLAAALLFGAVWMLNLYNFMDGIDGIAASEAVTVSLGGGVLLWMCGAPGMALMALCLAGASLGFLVWNFPPAKIFMGDAGSGFLGFIFACFAIGSLQLGPHVLAGWCVLLAAFASDASVTLLRRLLRGERVWEAHRSHAYQRLSRYFGAHRPVTLGFAAINVVWLVPLALMAGLQLMPAWLALAAAYLPLCLLAWRLGAGLPDDVAIRGFTSKSL